MDGTSLNILTFDLEDWFHVLDHPDVDDPASWSHYPSRVEKNTWRILDLLDTKGKKATFFCLGWVAEKHPSLIMDIVGRGHELGTHSYFHQLVYKQGRSDFRKDVLRSKSTLENIAGQEITAYRAPGFSVTPETPWVFDELVEAGFKYDCSVFPVRRAHGGFPGLPSVPFVLERNGGEITILPMSTFRFFGKNIVFSGGGYFRLLNYQLIRFMMLRSEYVMTYFHPRDFDADQPMIPGLGMIRRFKSFVGLRGALPKLEMLLEEFDFHELKSSVIKLDMLQLPRIKLMPH